jgi:hypothetical protein
MKLSIRQARCRLRKLHRDASGLAMIEFAFAAPILLVMGMAGMEAANYATVSMRLNQAAVHIADNVSRSGERTTLAVQRIYEEDVNDIFIGVNLQTGEGIDLYENGRVIVSSIERNSSGGQWIHWQRCKGKANHASAYGAEGHGKTGTAFKGPGPAGEELQAETGEAVIFVEIFYTYQPVVGNSFSDVFGPSLQMRTEAAFNVRNPRDLSELFDRTSNSHVSACTIFDGT